MFERFSEKAIKVIMLAQEEARRLGHNFVGTEMILLGLIGEGTGIGAKTLKSMGVNLKDARVEVEKIIGRGSGFVTVEIPFTPRAKRVLELSWDEARQLGHNYIGTEHLLLGLIRADDGVAFRVLENLGVDHTKVRSNVIRLLGQSESANREQAITGTTGRIQFQKEPPSIDKLSDSALKVIVHAREETRRLGHKQVLPLMILLGLMAEDASLAARSLKEAGVDLKSARDKVESLVGRGSGVIPVNSPLSQAVHELLNVAFEKSKRLGQDCVSGEHVLLALLEAGEARIQEVLKHFGVDPSVLKGEILAELSKDLPIAERVPGMPNLGESIKRKSAGLDPKPEPFSKFTDQANKVMMIAREESRMLGHNFVGTEQILLGLIIEFTGLAGRALEAQGVKLEAARTEVEKIIGRGSGFVALEIPYTPRAKRVLELAWDEAQNLGHTYIGTEHLLLGLLREGEGVAARVLEILGVDNTKLREKVIELSKEGGAATA